MELKELAKSISKIKNCGNFNDVTNAFIKYALEKESYECNGILNDSKFKESKQLICADNFYTREYVYLIELFGYERVNNILVEMLDSDEKEI